MPRPSAVRVLLINPPRVSSGRIELPKAQILGFLSLAVLLARVHDGTISNNAARQVFDALWAGEGLEVDALIDAKGLRQMRDAGALEAIVDEVLAKNAKSVDEFRAGKDKAFNALVGQVMKATQGKANPAQAAELLRRRLSQGG